MTCPHCGRPLEGLGRYCLVCELYTDEDAEERTAAVIMGAPDTRPEEEIRRDVVKALRALNFHVWDTEQGVPRRWVYAGHQGVPDLFIAGHGATVAVEMKSLKGVQTPEQIEYEAAWIANGGVYFVWRSLNDALVWARGLLP